MLPVTSGHKGQGDQGITASAAKPRVDNQTEQGLSYPERLPGVASAEFAHRVAQAHTIAREILTTGEPSLPSQAIDSGDVRLPSILYMTYWYHRFQHLPDEQGRIKTNLIEYIGDSVSDRFEFCTRVLSSQLLEGCARDYVRDLLLPIKTVDLVVVQEEGPHPDDRSVLCLERQYYPLGSALPGGAISEEDESNELGLPAELFAALRVAGQKILGTASPTYSTEIDENNYLSYVVSTPNEDRAVVIHPEDREGYRFRENVRTVFRPADPRHIVDTIGFRCELRGSPPAGLSWRTRSEVLSVDSPSGGFSFNHHRELVSHIIARTSIEKERRREERDFIRSLIDDPLDSYKKLKADFAKFDRPQLAPRPELFPVVDRVLREMYTPEINALCHQHPILVGIRDKATVNLRQVCLQNRIFCPYLPTLHAIFDGVAFFDVVAREKRGFYATVEKDNILEHNPGVTAHASYHMYRYKYRLDELLNRAPDEILIPTFESLSATDLMRVRGVPIRFIGLSTDFLYVDEFEQSPEEFMMHDANHSYRMMKEDDRVELVYGMSREELTQASVEFSRDYLNHIKIRKGDSEETRELKKLKKIILFEIVHEDARPFLPEVICNYIQQQEGSPVPFEVPHIDPKTGYMDIVDTLDTGISTLSYVRNKLQHGFYDRADAMIAQIVSPQYRTSEWIARAAHEMLLELGATPAPYAELGDDGKVSFEWLLRRACSVGPENMHEAVIDDPALQLYRDEAERLNPKRYQA